MGGHDDPRMAQKRIVGRGRLRVESVEGDPQQLSRVQSVQEGRLVDQPPASGVDQDRRRFHSGEAIRVDQARRLRGQWRVQRDHVGVGKEIVERAEGQTEASLLGGRTAEDVVVDQRRRPPLEPGCNLAADVSHSDNPDRLAGELIIPMPGRERTPLSGLDERREVGKAAQGGQGKHDRMLGNADRVCSTVRANRDAGFARPVDGSCSTPPSSTRPMLRLSRRITSTRR